MSEGGYKTVNISGPRSGKSRHRIQLVFDDKPPEVTRALLKQWGFRWSPIASAWQRHLNDAGRIAARIVLEKLGGGQS